MRGQTGSSPRIFIKTLAAMIVIMTSSESKPVANVYGITGRTTRDGSDVEQ